MVWQGRSAVRYDETRHPRRRGGCFGFASLRPPTAMPLSRSAYDAILGALDDEHRAQAFHTAVLERFPGAMPFRMIVEAEARHVDALAGLLRRRGLPVPKNVHLGSAEVRRSVPATATCACRIAVAAEEENVALYEEELMPLAEGWADVERVFRHLAEASRDRHLPAFRHWAEHHHHRGGTA